MSKRAKDKGLIRAAFGNLMSGMGRSLQRVRRSQHALEVEVEQLRKRIEFVREEVLFELRYSGSESGAPGSTPTTEPRVISKEKVSQAKADGLRINIGCGHKPMPDMVNIDARELPGVDIVSPVSCLPLEEDSVEEIYSAHLLEHFPQEELQRKLLPYWRGLIRPGGTFRAVVPDWQTMIERYMDGSYPYENLRLVTFGAQDYEGDFHFNMYTAESLKELLAETGFVDVEVLAIARENGACFEMELSATRPAAARVG